MPNFDNNGPQGLGPKTGMKLGECRKNKSDVNQSTENRPFRKGRRKKDNRRTIVKINDSL